jgi:hypothetical protein
VEKEVDEDMKRRALLAATTAAALDQIVQGLGYALDQWLSGHHVEETTEVLLQLPVTVIDALDETRERAAGKLVFWHGLARLGEPILEPSVPELIHRPDRSQDLALTSIVEKLQQTCWSLAPTLQLCAG